MNPVKMIAVSANLSPETFDSQKKRSAEIGAGMKNASTNLKKPFDVALSGPFPKWVKERRPPPAQHGLGARPCAAGYTAGCEWGERVQGVLAPGQGGNALCCIRLGLGCHRLDVATTPEDFVHMDI